MISVDTYYYSIVDNGYGPKLADAINILDDTEQDRYRRFKFDKDRNRFLQARILLKTCLAERLGCEPRDVHFEYNVNGKPRVSKGEYLHPKARVHFSLSHCATAIAFAISSDPVGIDIECISHRSQPWLHPEKYINEHIAVHFDRLTSVDEKSRMFARYWTCLEALVKLDGETLFQKRASFAEGQNGMFADGEFLFTDGVVSTEKVSISEQFSLATHSRVCSSTFQSLGI